MFTKSGGWTFPKAFDCIYDSLGAKERFLYSELSRLAVRPNQTRSIEWQGSPLVLQPGQHFFKMRELAQYLEMPLSTLSRTLASLETKGVITVLRTAKYTGGGTLLMVNQPDWIPKFYILRAARLKQLLDALRLCFLRPNPEKHFSLWNKLKQEVEQLRKAPTARLNLVFQVNAQLDETVAGTLDIINPRLKALEGDAGSQMPPLVGASGFQAPDGAEDTAAIAAEVSAAIAAQEMSPSASIKPCAASGAIQEGAPSAPAGWNGPIPTRPDENSTPEERANYFRWLYAGGPVYAAEMLPSERLRFAKEEPLPPLSDADKEAVVGLIRNKV